METVILRAPTMDCEACVKSIQRALSRVPGVHGVSVDLAAKQVSISFDAKHLSAVQVRDSLEAAGFPVEA